MGCNLTSLVNPGHFMSSALLFSGQGSQYVGMAADLGSTYTVASELASRANDVLGFDLFGMMSNGPSDVLTQTLNTQPALFLHEAMVLAITKAHSHASVVAGHSLGEFSALYAAGVVGFEECLRLVRKRGELMYHAGSEMPGTMAAVLGLDNDVVEQICAELSAQSDQVLVPANFNSPGQVVVSGSVDLVRSSLQVFKDRGARMAKELQVSGAFHSPLLASAQQQWATAVEATSFADATIPVYVNVSGEPVSSATDLKQAAIRQMTSPVLWTQTLQAMAGHGIKHFIEVGPQTVLQGLVKRTLTDVTMEGLDKVEDCKRYLESMGATQ